MARKRFTVESIVAMLKRSRLNDPKRESTVPEVLQAALNINDATYYKWRKEYAED